jgi:hypothetical protein
MTAYSEYAKSGMLYNLKVVMDVNESGLTLALSKWMMEPISVKTVKNQPHYSTRTTTCIQGQGVLISHHLPRWRKC